MFEWLFGKKKQIKQKPKTRSELQYTVKKEIQPKKVNYLEEPLINASRELKINKIELEPKYDITKKFFGEKIENSPEFTEDILKILRKLMDEK